MCGVCRKKAAAAAVQAKTQAKVEAYVSPISSFQPKQKAKSNGRVVAYGQAKKK